VSTVLPPVNGVASILLPSGEIATISECDINVASLYSWCSKKRSGSSADRRGGRYVHARVNGSNQTLHRILMNPPRDMVIDHIDGNGLRNTRDNLRIVTQRENLRNQRKRDKRTSRFFGVSRRSRAVNPWQCHFRLPSGKKIYVGVFATEEEAARDYDRLALIHFGEFARLNFPTTPTAEIA